MECPLTSNPAARLHHPLRRRCPTYPSPEPKETIDYITAYKKHARKLKVTSRRVANEPVASDHRPIVVELR